MAVSPGKNSDAFFSVSGVDLSLEQALETIGVVSKLVGNSIAVPKVGIQCDAGGDRISDGDLVFHSSRYFRDGDLYCGNDKSVICAIFHLGVLLLPSFS